MTDRLVASRSRGGVADAYPLGGVVRVTIAMGRHRRSLTLASPHSIPNAANRGFSVATTTVACERAASARPTLDAAADREHPSEGAPRRVVADVAERMLLLTTEGRGFRVGPEGARSRGGTTREVRRPSPRGHRARERVPFDPSIGPPLPHTGWTGARPGAPAHAGARTIPGSRRGREGRRAHPTGRTKMVCRRA